LFWRANLLLILAIRAVRPAGGVARCGQHAVRARSENIHTTLPRPRRPFLPLLARIGPAARVSLIGNASIGYRADLIINRCQRAANGRLTVSDVAIVRRRGRPASISPGAILNRPTSQAAPKTLRPHGAKATARKAKAILEAARQPAE
jgi:hypothetical protein